MRLDSNSGIDLAGKTWAFIADGQKWKVTYTLINRTWHVSTGREFTRQWQAGEEQRLIPTLEMAMHALNLVRPVYKEHAN